METIRLIKNMLWGPPLIILLLGTGLYFTLKSRFFQFTCAKELISFVKHNTHSSDKNGISPFMALSTALGGTVGVGSIIGVAYSISVGGAGSIFWMWISGFLGMMTKYAEVAIALKYRERKNGVLSGGAMYALRALGRPKTAVIFAITCISASIGAGNLAQTNAIAELLSYEGVPNVITAIIVTILLALVIFKGQRFIAKMSAFVVPAISTLYLIAALAVIIVYFKQIPTAIVEIFSNAFGFDAVAGGFSGAMISSAFKNGLTKGVFSHEAGMGSSPIAHAASENADPHSQGLWGIFEVFFDTFIVSTITALALLCVGTVDIGSLFRIFLGGPGGIFILIAISIFAFAAALAWCFYAESCITFLSDSKAILTIYRIIFTAIAFVGAIMSRGAVWELSDIFNGIMIIPNLYLLILARKEIVNTIKNKHS